MKEHGFTLEKQVEQTLKKEDFFKGYKRPEYFKTGGRCDCKNCSCKKGKQS
ncbi:hypothetical protein DFP93_101213 [Aneurinibacillus soli]|uniref:Uncharacterized protein n=1 Tax=Aneurinibacillus soli TaxID=1500254 RepID=A0A0U4WHL3_9BACL|nr:hypothetical protein [Aneurinibacillus soli]PYE64188.1 hypothetical protein DFP93_101213 [Aneurinibacillus soli]BAU28137.1 hypothetical protein CB4_02311 [Aneurinibacillus soli]